MQKIIVVTFLSATYLPHVLNLHIIYISLTCDKYFCSYLLKVPNGKEPLKQFLVHIIFNAALWIKAKTNVSFFHSMHV